MNSLYKKTSPNPTANKQVLPNFDPILPILYKLFKNRKRLKII